MSLADLLATQRDEVMRRWRVRISKKLGVGSLERTELEDDLPRFVDELVDVLRAESSGYGEAPETPSAIDHGADRLRLGFDVSEIVREYGVLHQVILDLAADEAVQPMIGEQRVMVRCFSTAVATAVAEFERRRDAEIERQAAQHLAFLAHELRNPLMTARLALGILRRGPLQSGGPHVDASERSLRALQDLIDTELVRTRMHRTLTLDYEELRIADLIQSAVDESATDAAEKGIRLVIEIAEQPSIDGDRKLLRSAVTNLIRNAVKFTRRDGTIIVRARVLTGGHLCMDVEDECGGLPDGKLDELFSPFVQAGADRSGFGLGLAISKQAVEAHHGTIHVRNVPDKGCVFTIDLPCRRSA